MWGARPRRIVIVCVVSAARTVIFVSEAYGGPAVASASFGS